ncbi:S-adenosylmethionine-dependent methyltransferase CYBJADRAFT_177236 [Cyberlindnera jadinii NRRL Y-1542]|uniref:Uncharacterized protein n=1 Tax=Cyberlindnera jadinii (strain ATCC 18201 / CBS 1600 / BCRC 20928 / JCM 3617 / NBRC 0987 / NRRL Y-1542) TaxID=983966 RepID=A0A1E4S519_CYBJN|nr:hypothetical protein CYBJADRAFT_177236 [Cyberlindnera jadinii NRRL Y-1542]ODV74543.1 hypothetical protein CYBJADRAFT_177236 [Cyberlindnera jadinii NRRL Y-1542]
MDFDPLSFFTPDSTDGDDHVDTNNGVIPRDGGDVGGFIPNVDDGDLEDGDLEEGPLHILDFPQLNGRLPAAVLISLLKLLARNEETNFGKEETLMLDQLLVQRSIDLEDYGFTLQWLRDHGYVKLARCLPDVPFNQDTFQYLNKILSSHFIEDADIAQLTSLRISENCGRTARPQFTRKIIIDHLETPILLNEPALTSDSLGLKTWGSSLVLSELLAKTHEGLDIHGEILELGAGTGLVGITLSKLGYEVVLTDLPEILDNLRKNVELNSVDSECHVLDWTDPSSFVEIKGPDVKYTTVVVADPIYSPEHPQWVVNMVDRFLSKSSESQLLIQIPLRQLYESERQLLWSLLKEIGLRVVEEQYVDGFDDFGEQKFVYKRLKWQL